MMSTMIVDKEGSNHSRTSTASWDSYDSSNDNLEEFGEILTSSADTARVNNKKKRVRFGSLEVHEHAIVLGGNGVPTCGPPISLEWEEQAYYMVKSVEFFEDSRPFDNMRGAQLIRSKSDRMKMLQSAGHSPSDINRVMKENELIRKQRCETIKKIQRFPALSKVLGR